MFGEDGYDQVGALSCLLQKCREDSDSSSSTRENQPPIAGSAVVVTKSSKTGSTATAVPTKDIWEDTEIPTEEAVVARIRDDRPSPRYEICYKQDVGTEDTFLGLGNKTPSSEDCSHLVRFSLHSFRLRGWSQNSS